MTMESNSIKKQRIWEIDAFRGFCILCVIIVHFIFDLNNFTKVNFSLPDLYMFIQDNGGVLFIILSGISVTLGTRSVKRGFIVFLLGMAITLFTYIFDPDYTIKFGILHFLGLCMILYPIIRKMPNWALILTAALIIASGYWLKTIYVDTNWLFPIGIINSNFSSSDYFPILPHLGYFIIGILLGKTIYKNKETLFPGKLAYNKAIKGLTFCGRHSLWIYLAHQPIIIGIFTLYSLFT